MYLDILDTLSDARAELTRESYKVTCNQLGLDDLVAPSFEHFAAWFVIEGIGGGWLEDEYPGMTPGQVLDKLITK